MSTADFICSNHVPPFADEILNTTTDVSQCRGDRECIFDTVVTGRMEIGLATLMVDEMVEHEFRILGMYVCV